MAKRLIERKLQALEDLRHAPDDAQKLQALRKALSDRSNFVAAKAATIAGQCHSRELVPELLRNYERFFPEPLQTDPQCIAKIAIAKALKDHEYQEPEPFLRGLAHVQMEPAWGGAEDSAVNLRATCAHALVVCHLDSHTILGHLTDTLADDAAPVRAEAARAIGNLGQQAGRLVLRLKAKLSDEKAEVTGECLSALLALGESAEFLMPYLQSVDPDLRSEAAAALIESRDPEAFRMVAEHYRRELDETVKSAILTLAGASPLPEAATFLYGMLEQSSGTLAAAAVRALIRNRHWPEYQDRVAELIAGSKDRSLEKAYRETRR